MTMPIEPVIQALVPRFPVFNVATHSGKFHADEIAGLAILTPLFQNMAVYRTRDTGILKMMDLCIDVGGGPFDHHLRSNQRYRENGVPLASAGLVWEAYGEKYVWQLIRDQFLKMDEQAVKDVVAIVDRNVIEPIDAQDCGMTHTGRHCMNWVASFNSTWIHGNSDQSFVEAVHFACTLLRKEVQVVIARVASHDIVARQLNAADSVLGALPREAGILILEQFVPWIESLHKLDPEEQIKLVVFHDVNDGWRVQAVPKAGDKRFANRITLPESWRGKVAEDLVLSSGVVDATFCHTAGFIAGAATREGALEMAKRALQAA